jgi:hypothetical protein
MAPATSQAGSYLSIDGGAFMLNDLSAGPI